ncbi:MAG: pentapeptide repeat-containing protein, partial [Bacteroidota bacterium]|nr:pentapeptide repeat-containing protein [Bacteroidota bacterium]
KADFTESELLNCQFEVCNFSLAKFVGTGMKEIKFMDCKLIGINFDNCSDFLFAVEFQQSILDYSSFAEKKMKKTKFATCSMKEVDFSGTDLSISVFENCDLLGTVFKYTNLEKVDFRTAYNYGFDPEINKIKQARFSLSGIAGLLGKYNIEIE